MSVAGEGDREMSVPPPAVESTRPKADGLLERMAVLARLIEQAGPNDPRRSVMQEMLHRLLMFGRMCERLELERSHNPLMRALLWEAEWSCMSCSSRGRCSAWLDADAGDHGYRRFCPNATLFDQLPRRSTSNREA